MSSERRTNPRFAIKQLVDLSTDGERFVKVTGTDLSEGGLACTSSMPLDPLSQVYIMLDLETEGQSKIYHLEGYVAHVRKVDDTYYAGISFDLIPPEAQEALDAFCQTNTPIPDPSSSDEG